jgi:hypothetical protein
MEGVVNLAVNESERDKGGVSDGSTKNSAKSSAKSSRLVDILSRCGLSKAGLVKLDKSSIQQLAVIIEGAGSKAALTLKMFNAVAETSPEQLQKLVATMQGYAGSLPILNTFLMQLGTWDPFLATSRAKIDVLPHRSFTEIARGASGHVLKGVTYCAYDEQFPGTTTGFVSGKQAITKILEAFNSERIGVAKRSVVTERRNSALKDALSEINIEELTLNDFDANPRLARELGRNLITRNLEVYNELRSAIELCRANLARFAYGDELLLAKSQSLKVASDIGRTFFGWFESHFEENQNAPVGIKIAYLSLRDPDIELSQEDERRYIQGLLAYQRIHSFINKSSALGGFLKDLESYERLKADDPLRFDPGIEQARRVLQGRMARSDQELTISEFGALLDNAAMVEFRREMNQRALAGYEAELSEALKKFEFVSFEGGAWRDDALGDAVPMARLKQHLYGAKIGVVRSSDTVSDKRALLDNSDFRHIMRGQFLWRLIPEREKLLTARPVAEFKEMVEGIIVAYRKVKYLEQQLAKYQIERNDSSASFNLEDVGDALKDWKPVLPIGRQYRPCEVWGEGEDSFKPEISDLREVSVRLRAVGTSLFPSSAAARPSKLGDKYRNARVSCDLYAAAGLYDPKMFDLWRGLERKVRGLKITSDLEDKLNQATRLLINPIAKLLPWRAIAYGQKTEDVVTRLLNQSYFTDQHERLLDSFLELRNLVDELSGCFNTSELAQIDQRIATLNLDRAVIYEVAFSQTQDGLKQIALSDKKFLDMVRDARAKDPRALETVLKAIEEQTVSVASLAPDWNQRAKRLFSGSGTALLRSKGFAPIDRRVYDIAQGFGLDPVARVSRELANIVG